jgi:cell division protein FtsW
VVAALVLVGLLVVYSASAAHAAVDRQLQRHLVYVAIGTLALVTAASFDYHRLAHPVVFRLFALISLTLLVVVLLPGMGAEEGGARRWIVVAGQPFQPSEFAKFAMILLLAVKLSENQEQLGNFFTGFLPPVLIMVMFSGLIVLENDLGVPAVMTAVAMVMIVAAGARWRHIVVAAVPIIGAAVALSLAAPHRVRRLMAFADPWKYRDNESFQLIQSLAAFVRGGVLGQGPGAGEQKLFYLPAAHTDFIFAVWAEEMGLVGCLALIGLFMLLVSTGVRIALGARELFGALLAVGITALMAVQGAVNMAVTCGLLPTKGLPLPFISWGGSSLIVLMFLSGILLNIGLQGESLRKAGQMAATQEN